jgi:DNA gyrase subunit A
MTEDGCIKRIPTSSFKTQKRNGKGVKSQDDITKAVIKTNTVDSLMIFSNQGRMYRLLVNDIPVGTNISKGYPIKALIAMENKEEASVIYSIYKDTDAKYVLFTTKNGLIKKTALDEYIKTKKKTGVAAISLREGDSLASVSLIKDESLILITKQGMSIKFDSKEVAPTGRNSTGVKGMTLKDGDEIITTLPIRNNKDALGIFSENGLGKKVSLSDLVSQKRGGKGTICYKVGVQAGAVSDAVLISDEDILLVCGDSSSICVSATEIPKLGRTSIGNHILKGSKILSVSKV